MLKQCGDVVRYDINVEQCRDVVRCDINVELTSSCQSWYNVETTFNLG